MTGKEAVAEAIKRMKDGRCVKLWREDWNERVECYPSGMYVIFYQGEELCRGINGAADFITEKFINDPKVGLL